MSTRGSILLAVGMLILGVVIGGLAGGVSGYFIGRNNARAFINQPVPPMMQPFPNQAQPIQPTPPSQTNPNTRRTFPQAQNVLGGAQIQEVEQDSPAAKAGLQVNDIVTAVGSTKLDTTHALGDVIQTYKPGDKVDLSVTRGTQTLSITVQLGASTQDSTKPMLGVKYTTVPAGRRLQTNPTQ